MDPQGKNTDNTIGNSIGNTGNSIGNSIGNIYIYIHTHIYVMIEYPILLSIVKLYENCIKIYELII